MSFKEFVVHRLFRCRTVDKIEGNCFRSIGHSKNDGLFYFLDNDILVKLNSKLNDSTRMIFIKVRGFYDLNKYSSFVISIYRYTYKHCAILRVFRLKKLKYAKHVLAGFFWKNMGYDHFRYFIEKILNK